MNHSGIWVVGHGASLQSRVPLPTEGSVADHLEFYCHEEDIYLHVAVENLVDTWRMDDLVWRRSSVAGWVETALFSRDGADLVAVSPVGIRYVWRVADGALLGMDNFDSESHLIHWAPQWNIGAICFPDMIEIVDEKRMYVAHFNDALPHSVTWNRDGQRLAWAGANDSLIRWAQRSPSGFERSILREKEGYYPLSPALSSSGQTLAYIRGYLRQANLPEMGISVKMGWSGGRLHRMASGLIKEGIVLVDLESDVQQTILTDHPAFLVHLQFVGEDTLIAVDDTGCIMGLDLPTLDVTTRCWIAEPAVASWISGHDLRLCDTGMTAAFGPVVYDFKLHLPE